MRVLLDECVPRKLAGLLVGHDVRTVPRMGWASHTNGDLLRLATEKFDAFVTMDGSLPSQQNLSRFPFRIIILRVPSNRLGDIRRLVPPVLSALEPSETRHIVVIGG